MGKASVSNIMVFSRSRCRPQVLAMARLSAVASLLAILPPSSSRFGPLALYCYTPLTCWHTTAPHRLAPYSSSSLAGIPSAQWLRSPLYPPSLHSSLVTPSRGIALPPLLQPTPWIDPCNFPAQVLNTVTVLTCESSCFPLMRDH